MEVVQTKMGHKVEYRGKNSFGLRKATIDREWEVRTDEGDVMGTLIYRMMTRERKTQGKMYVDARWQSPGWSVRFGSNFGRSIEVYSKSHGIEYIVNAYERRNRD